TITPQVLYPFGEAPVILDPQGRALEHVSFSVNSSSLMLAGASGTQLHVLSLDREENLMTGEVSLSERRLELPQIAEPIKQLIIDPRQMWLYVINGRATADVFDLRNSSLNGRYKLNKDAGTEVTAASMLVGGISLMVGDSAGRIQQWFMVRDDDGKAELEPVRAFEMAGSPIRQIIPEQRRKGFLALDQAGNLGVFHSTAHRTLLVESV